MLKQTYSAVDVLILDEKSTCKIDDSTLSVRSENLFHVGEHVI